MKKLVIYGLGEFAKLVSHYIEQENKYNVVAYCADKKFINSSKFNDKFILNIDDIKNEFDAESTEILVACGYRSMKVREEMFNKASCLGFNFASMISSNSSIDNSATLGRNCIVMPGVQIEPHVIIGDNLIIWTSSVLCHESIINSHSFIAAQTIIGGRSVIGMRCFLGFNTTIINDVNVGDDCLVGAKSLVTRNIPSRSKSMGIPAKLISKISDDGVCIH